MMAKAAEAPSLPTRARMMVSHSCNPVMILMMSYIFCDHVPHSAKIVNNNNNNNFRKVSYLRGGHVADRCYLLKTREM